MIDRRTKNAEIFRDTERRYVSDPTLIQAVRKSTEAQVFIAEKDSVNIPVPHKSTDAKVIVSGKRSLEAAECYAKQSKKVCVLNFASATNPGGGVVNGSSAQEECLCRCTTLYPCLKEESLWRDFTPHIARRQIRYIITIASILPMYVYSKAILIFPNRSLKTSGGMLTLLRVRHRIFESAQAMR